VAAPAKQQQPHQLQQGQQGQRQQRQQSQRQRQHRPDQQRGELGATMDWLDHELSAVARCAAQQPLQLQL